MSKGSNRRQGEDTVEIDNNWVSAFPKLNLEQDEEYLDWIRLKPCCVRNRECRGQIAPHHIKRRAECSDHETVPLCWHHHTGSTNCVHSSKTMFEGRHNIDLKEEAERLKEEWDARC